MANIILARGGTPDFKGFMCEGQYAEWTPPYDAPHMPATPPYDSHADAAYGQGYLNLHFPLVPNLNDTRAHAWMQNALQKCQAVGDDIMTNWVPLRSYLESYYIEVVKTDPMLDGVYVTPGAWRCAWNFTTQQWTYTPITAFRDELTANGIGQFPLGTPASGDKMYGVALLNNPKVSVTVTGTLPVTVNANVTRNVPTTFGHNLVVRNSSGTPTGPLDSNFGAVMIGLEVTAGQADRIKNIWRSNIAVYTTAKLKTFEGSSQVG